MKRTTFRHISILCIALFVCTQAIYGQEVPIRNFSTNAGGQALIEIQSTADHYYILEVRHSPSEPFGLATSMTLGEDGSTVITEPLGAYPQSHYRVLEFAVSSPADSDGDGLDDIREYNNVPTMGPLNAAKAIDLADGTVAVDNLATFKKLSITRDRVQWAEYLNGKGFVKYIITDYDTDSAKTYFINSEKHWLHQDFANALGIDFLGAHIKKGELIYHPTTVSNNGSLGTFTFNFSNGHGEDFAVVQRCHEVLAANMPFLKNNFSFFVTTNSADEYERDSLLYEQSRVPVLFESDIYATVDYWALNLAEGYGLFRHLDFDETPGSRDIVLYESLPNSLPRVGGIMTGSIQSPLSHVNLRAIQDNIPNAFIRDPLAVDSIAALLDGFVYYKVEQNGFTIRRASIEEVNNWYNSIRPDEAQQPPLDLSYTAILPLRDIHFDMSDAFGAKCTNVATMRTFGFPEGTIPDGFGVPFYFYQEFMKHNDFFDEVENMLKNADFMTDRALRDEMLKDFRKEIEKADMPGWMLDELAAMHATFPAGTSIRCRSSTNNEDLPGFSGAGLYDSKTQHPNEGHISKSIKQVYASLWNLKAFEERDFFRVDHFRASMGVLCHPNYSEERVNGVGVSIDPVYQTQHTYYLNSQLGEDLITNPDTSSVPEEILLDKVATSNKDYILVRRSNLIPADSQLLGDSYLDHMRGFMTVIHNEFAVLYNAVGNETFAVDIEYKITREGQLIIKQARPWVSYIPFQDSLPGQLAPPVVVFPNPTDDILNVACTACEVHSIRIVNLEGKLIAEENIEITPDVRATLSTQNLPPGMYILSAFEENGELLFSEKFIRR
ncbi:MAG: PEP/pyruvate-binding domain-containing protein [Bacteroidia bacterium]